MEGATHSEVRPMGTSDCLKISIQHTHDGLAERLDAARQVIARPEETRRGCPPIDMFCARASQHLHAVDHVLLPSARAREDYCAAEHRLGVLLTHVKAHEFGSTYERGFSWPGVWGEVDDALAGYRAEEELLVDTLTASLSDEALEAMVQRMAEVEPTEPTRPHPYLPHQGVVGRMARQVERVADAFWDAVEGRYVPEREHAPKKTPGRWGSYVLGDPRFDEEEPPA